jgi:PEGA domain
MKSLLAILLFCLLIVGTATAVSGIQVGRTIDLQLLTDISCSTDVFSPSPGANIIWVVFVNGHGDTYIDGQGKMPMWAETLGGKPGFQYPVSIGTHQVVFFKPGYNNYSVNVAVCNGTVTYVYYDQPKYLITTAMTTIPTSATTVPVTTTVSTTSPVQQITQQQTQLVTQQATQATLPDTTGSLSVTTTPAGATILVDGVMRGASPATIPGIPAGSHTLLLKLDGYQDMSMPVTITAGKTQEYSTAMIQAAASAPATSAAAETPVTPKRAPGFEFIPGLVAAGAILTFRRSS